jgi:hypothetical protein
MQELIIFLLAIPFPEDSSHMDDLTRSGNDRTWKTNGMAQIHTFHNVVGAFITSQNTLAPRHIVFSSFCYLN